MVVLDRPVGRPVGFLAMMWLLGLFLEKYLLGGTKCTIGRTFSLTFVLKDS
jgi:hypothetical protein